jgi:hypothetical protein
MLLLNFSHPLLPDQVKQIEELTGQSVEEVRHLPVQFDPQQPFAPQVEAVVADCELTPEAWQTESILINPPALNAIAVTLLAELHGRMGYFPPVVRLRPVAGSTPPRFEVAEVINLQQVRDEARLRR